KVKQLRRQGIIPGVVYGQSDAVSVQMDQKLLRRALRVAGTTQLATLDIEGDSRTVLVREIQQHLTRGDIFHVDFLEVDMKSTLTSEIELIMVGEPGEETGGMGVVTLTMRYFDIECLPGDLVDSFEVDISQVKTINDVIYVRDIVIPEAITLLTDVDRVVARFEVDKLVEEDEIDGLDETAADGVEVIGAADDDEEAVE
ncbi:MAG: 50S ribosomal protein L25, partial [Methylococcales bacterium]|nr:50S ribosomal protein L25 [Methylococcales bacterium]